MKHADSKTKVNLSSELRLHGGRTVTSIRIKPELEEALNKFCKANGVSICHVFEMLVSGYLTGMQQKITWVNQSPTIELTVVREVQRLRRAYRVDGSTLVEQKPHCSECLGDASFRLEKEGMGWVYSCYSHLGMFKNRGFIRELAV